ncbi:MAG: hypothetical protein JNL70_03105 [Saprospiraceae bacterium]|nr:hypothetical protein [Saprospiraceae bacterium]
MKQLTILFTVFTLFSCHSPQQISQKQTDEPPIVLPPQILFLQIKVFKKGDVVEAQIANRTTVAGILDRDARGLQLIENEWLISFYDKRKELLDQVTVPNPLHQHFEVADDNGQLKGVEVKKEEADFFFRVAHNPSFATIQVEQITANKQKINLFSLTF